MVGPLDSITYNQEPGFMPIALVAGDDLPITVSLPFDITSYTFSGNVVDSFGAIVDTFTITKTQLAPIGILSISLTNLETALIPDGATYFIKWALSGKIRTFLYGPISAKVLS